jgi:CubicO group peptidase (beta-lactamase class C family)
MSRGGFCEERLGRLYDVMAGYVERGEVPGVVTLLWRRGELRVNTIGTMAFGAIDQVRTDTIFRLASMTKPITAAAALILVEECRLRLDDPIEHWLPELTNRRVLRRLDGPLDDTVPAKRSITLRDLLTYRMGFGSIWEPCEAYPILKAAEQLRITAAIRRPDPDEWIARLGSLPLMHQPGEKWMYNLSSDVLGVLMARVSNQPLETFLRERLFDPLGMKDTGFSVPTSKLQRLSTLYWSGLDERVANCWIDWCPPPSGTLVIRDAPGNSKWSIPPDFPSAATGLVSTTDDYLAFGQMMLNNGKYAGKRVLSRPSVETMTADHLTADQRAISGFFSGFFENRSWGFGLSVAIRRDHPSRPIGRFGMDGGYGTSWYCDPGEELIGIVMTQRAFTAASPLDFCRDFWTLAYQAIDD